jgi:hypothetical protein
MPAFTAARFSKLQLLNNRLIDGAVRLLYAPQLSFLAVSKLPHKTP